jgi:hypothetical protein
MCLKGCEPHSHLQQQRLDDRIEIGLEKGKAWAAKEILRDLCRCSDKAAALAPPPKWR